MEAFLEEARSLPEADSDSIDLTARELSYYHYEPSLLLSVPDFTRVRKKDIIEELEKLRPLGPDDLEAAGVVVKGDGPARVSSAAELKREQASLLMYHYKQLLNLRNDEPEAWHVMDELYEEE